MAAAKAQTIEEITAKYVAVFLADARRRDQQVAQAGSAIKKRRKSDA